MGCNVVKADKAPYQNIWDGIYSSSLEQSGLRCGPYYNFNVNSDYDFSSYDSKKLYIKFEVPAIFIYFYKYNGKTYFNQYNLKFASYEKNIISDSNGYESFETESYTSCPKYFFVEDSDVPVSKFSNQKSEFNNQDVNKIWELMDTSHFESCKYSKVDGTVDLWLHFYDDGNNYLIIPNTVTQKQLKIDLGYSEAWHNNDVFEKGCPNICSGGTSGSGLSFSNDYIWVSTDSFSYNVSTGGSCDSIQSSTSAVDVNICAYYDKYLEGIKDFYNDAKNCDKSVDKYCDKEYIMYADKNISEVNEICSHLYRFYDAIDPCIKKCFDFNKELIDIRSEYGISGITNDCNVSDRVLAFIANIIKWVKYIAPVIAIILGILDFIKAIISSSDDDMKKSQGKFVKRLIAAALLFIVPFIIEFVLDKFNIVSDYCNII